MLLSMHKRYYHCGGVEGTLEFENRICELLKDKRVRNISDVIKNKEDIARLFEYDFVLEFQGVSDNLYYRWNELDYLFEQSICKNGTITRVIPVQMNKVFKICVKS